MVMFLVLISPLSIFLICRAFMPDSSASLVWVMPLLVRMVKSLLMVMSLQNLFLLAAVLLHGFKIILQSLFIFGRNNRFFAIQINGIAINLAVPFFAGQNSGALWLLQSADHALLFLILGLQLGGDAVADQLAEAGDIAAVCFCALDLCAYAFCLLDFFREGRFNEKLSPALRGSFGQ
nr:MAG TPA: hypothetical protein [Caudoviricetes sp.]